MREELLKLASHYQLAADMRNQFSKHAALSKISSTRVMRELAKRVAAAGGAKVVAKNPSLVPLLEDLQAASRKGTIDSLADRQLTYLGRGNDGRASVTLGKSNPGLDVRKVPLTNEAGSRSKSMPQNTAAKEFRKNRTTKEIALLSNEARGHEMIQKAFDRDPRLRELVTIPQYRGWEPSTERRLGNIRTELMDVGEGGLTGMPLRDTLKRTAPVSEASFRLARKHKVLHIDTHQGNVKYVDSAGNRLDKPVMFDFGRAAKHSGPITQELMSSMASTPLYPPNTGATPKMFGMHGNQADFGTIQAASGFANAQFTKGKRLPGLTQQPAAQLAPTVQYPARITP